MTSFTRIAAVTGSNKGIGLSIVKQLALRLPSPSLIYLTSRSEQRGRDALSLLERDEELVRSKILVAQGGATEVRWLGLDVGDETSVREFVKRIGEIHPGGIDVLVNNAGVALDGFNSQVVRDTLNCNYHGTLQVTQSMIPLIKDGGRIVNVASIIGQLTPNPAFKSIRYSDQITQKFRSAATKEDVDRLMRDFQRAVDDGSFKSDWPESAYAVSKCGLIAATMAIARTLKGGRSIQACCPGWVGTDMTKHKGTKTPDQGAETPVRLALGELGGAQGESGRFWQEEKELQW